MNLNEFFEENNCIAVAFSGGVDSSYLLYAAHAANIRVKGYYVKSVFQPDFETEDAVRLAREQNLEIEILYADVLSDEIVRKNPQNRCYFCKKLIFTQILSKAHEDGFALVCDGTNASDDIDDRPGMKALAELGVRSPLREAGLTKSDIRKRSEEYGLFTYNKPAYACLATRIPCGMEITPKLLKKVEDAEKSLFELGFTDFRVRVTNHGDTAKLQLNKKDFSLFSQRHEEVSTLLLKHFSEAALDLKISR